MAIKQFDSVTTPLHTSINLIEASAGTGKTYAIAMLALRFVVEQGIPIDQLLVVTFTKAATEELKERIRNRLSEAKRGLEGNTDNLDAPLLNWLSTLPLDKVLAKQRLQLALLDIDQAGIFTIHGFCQRVLKEHALESGQLFDSELTGNIDAIRQDCANDFWRSQVYPRSLQQAAILTAEFKTPDTLLASIKNIPSAATIYPDAENLDKKLANIDVIFGEAGEHLKDHATKIIAGFADEKFKTDFAGGFEVAYQQLDDWLQNRTSLMPTLASFEMFSLEGLKQGLNGNKFRKNKTQSGDERKQEYLVSLDTNTKPFDEIIVATQQITLAFRRLLVAYLQDNLDQQLQQLNSMSFDQLITRLANALQGDKGLLLIQQLQQRFKVALIDEFQDTDQAQWTIFSTIFANSKQHLYLIGDPKQAIYKFRGADIFSYFAAQKKAQHHFTLGQNWRSHPSLIKAVNILFSQQDDAFLFAQLQFIPATAALTNEDGHLHRKTQALIPLQFWQLPNSETSTGYWTAGKAGTELQIAVVNEVLLLLDGETYISCNNQDQQLKPADIAILVRKNSQAREYQEILRFAGIPAVLNSTESVFNTSEAQDLYILLQAVAHPGNLEYLRQSLTLGWFNMNGQQLYQTINDESQFDAVLNRFQAYYQYWQSKGLMAMMYYLLEQESIPQYIAQNLTAERQYTNLHHLIELVQQAAMDDHLGIFKTLDWLADAITKEGHSEEQQLRLESDAEAVKIVTMHRAKGLEYPVVFCPYLWQRNSLLDTEKQLVKYHDNETIAVDLGSENFTQHREQAITEDLAEDIRLLYVAVTRAKYRCYVAWADVRSKNKANTSAFSYLLFAQADQNWQENLLKTDFSTQQSTLQAISEQAPETIQYKLLETSVAIQGHYQSNTKQQKLTARQRQRSLATTWQMSSYTALSALSQHNTPELPIDKAQEQQNNTGDKQVLALPKGAHTGNVIHELLEITPFKTLAGGADIDKQRDLSCLRYGLHCEQPTAINDLLNQVVQTPLSSENPSWTLANIGEQYCLKEMPFYLSISNINVDKINVILKGSPTFLPLSTKQLSGFLTGFIDLICEYQGRFYVMDYKTNWLPDYQPESLTAAMKEHNYGLQYWIYSLVLHQYLQQRLPEYDYESHFGGVKYLFVRGMEQEVPMSGVYQDRPDLVRIEALGNLFS
jgi:exodeoxyribonuclease V beta subunit